jgi:hypothetical protein
VADLLALESSVPRLAIPGPNKRYLDLDPDLPVARIRELIRTVDVEILVICDEEAKLAAFAPVIGERASVDVRGLEWAFAERWLLHNHPLNAPLSDLDLAVAARSNARGIEAVLCRGGSFVCSRPEDGWPDETELIQSWRTGFLRALKLRESADADELARSIVKEVNRAFRASFQRKCPQVIYR